MVDRRRFLLITQGWMVVAAGALGVLTLLHYVTPWVLLAVYFHPRIGRGDERPGLAGDYTGNCLARRSTRPPWP